MGSIRAFLSDDFDQWLALWNENNEGRENDAVANTTWGRITNPMGSVKGLGYFLADGTLAGLLHYIVHPVTGSIEPVAYMQDVFVNPKHRRNGIARKLVSALKEIGDSASWNRIYWLAESDNTAAQELYKNIGLRLDFTLHIIPITLLKK